MSTSWPTHKDIKLNRHLINTYKKVHKRYDTIQYDAMRYDTIRYDTIKGGNCFTLAARSEEAKFLQFLTRSRVPLLKTSPLSYQGL